MPAETELAQVPTHIAPAEVCLIPVAAAALGFTPKALERQIERGVLPEGVVWFTAPNGRRHIDLPAYARWARGGNQRGT